MANSQFICLTGAVLSYADATIHVSRVAAKWLGLVGLPAPRAATATARGPGNQDIRE